MTYQNIGIYFRNGYIYISFSHASDKYHETAHIYMLYI